MKLIILYYNLISLIFNRRIVNKIRIILKAY